MSEDQRYNSTAEIPSPLVGEGQGEGTNNQKVILPPDPSPQGRGDMIRFSFIQLLILLTFQIALLSGAFYLGTKWSGSSKRISKGPIQDQEVAHLLPQANSNSEKETSNPLSPPAKIEGGEKSPGQKTFTAFDKSASTVFRIKSSANSEYTLQIASYPDESAAIQVVEEWKRKGYVAFLSVEDIPDKGKWYRINIGNYGDEASAQEFAKRFQEKENVVPQVVVSQ